MRSGALRDLITIQHDTGTTYDEINQPVPNWTTFKTAYASVKVVRGKEQFDPVTHQRYAETVYRFRCRFADVDGVTEVMRISFDGSYYDIKSVLPDTERQDDCVIEAVLLSP